MEKQTEKTRILEMINGEIEETTRTLDALRSQLRTIEAAELAVKNASKSRSVAIQVNQVKPIKPKHVSIREPVESQKEKTVDALIEKLRSLLAEQTAKNTRSRTNCQKAAPPKPCPSVTNSRENMYLHKMKQIMNNQKQTVPKVVSTSCSPIIPPSSMKQPQRNAIKGKTVSKMKSTASQLSNTFGLDETAYISLPPNQPNGNKNVWSNLRFPLPDDYESIRIELDPTNNNSDEPSQFDEIPDVPILSNDTEMFETLLEAPSKYSTPAKNLSRSTNLATLDKSLISRLSSSFGDVDVANLSDLTSLYISPMDKDKFWHQVFDKSQN